MTIRLYAQADTASRSIRGSCRKACSVSREASSLAPWPRPLEILPRTESPPRERKCPTARWDRPDKGASSSSKTRDRPDDPGGVGLERPESVRVFVLAQDVTFGRRDFRHSLEQEAE